MEQLLEKAHVKGYSKKDGTYVKPHDRKGGDGRPEPTGPVHHHPKMGDNGKPVVVKNPTHPSSHSTWHNPDAVATFVPNGDCPASLNGVALTRWRDHPRTAEGWDYLDGINDDIYEPPFNVPAGKHPAAGVVIEEPDGRVWITHPTNAFGGYHGSWPKGTAEPDMSLQATAIKETFEETGLKIEITGYIGDFERSTSVARMYRAKRVGGTPTDAGWESQGVSLVPKGLLYEQLNHWGDHGIAETVGAGPAPKKPEPPKPGATHQKTLF